MVTCRADGGQLSKGEMMASAYKEAPSPQLIEIGVLYQLACCDCGLIHDETYFIKDGKTYRERERNNRSTGQYRRQNNITVRKVDLDKKKDDNTNRH